MPWQRCRRMLAAHIVYGVLLVSTVHGMMSCVHMPNSVCIHVHYFLKGMYVRYAYFIKAMHTYEAMESAVMSSLGKKITASSTYARSIKE